MNGGYFGGQINDGGTIYNLIVAPVSSGSLIGSYTSGIKYKTTASADTPAATVQNEVYGGSTTNLFTASAAHPVFSGFINYSLGPNAGAFNLATGGAGGGTGIGGFNDWYLPAKDELSLLCSNLAPSSTTSTLFESGGSQTFSDNNYYWSSTEVSSITGNAWGSRFSNCFQTPTSTKDVAFQYCRAIRRVAA